MAYLVKITVRAERDLSLLFAHIRAEHSDSALAWYRRLKEAIFSLEHHPYRCPVTDENRNLRHLLFGHKPDVYRIIFRVVERRKQVDVLHIRHGARGKFNASDVG